MATLDGGNSVFGKTWALARDATVAQVALGPQPGMAGVLVEDAPNQPPVTVKY